MAFFSSPPSVWASIAEALRAVSTIAACSSAVGPVVQPANSTVPSAINMLFTHPPAYFGSAHPGNRALLSCDLRLRLAALMKHLTQYFLRGLFTALPVGLTVYLLYLFLAWMEKLSAQLARPLLGEAYVTGIGLVLGVTGIVLLGFLVSQPFASRLLSLIELPFTNLPVVKNIYASLKDFADFFSPKKPGTQQTVVALKPPGQALELVGLITRQQVDDLPAGFERGDRVAVYLPMGYMIGGYTVFVPREWIRVIDMPVEEAMRASLFAWMGNTEDGGR